MLLTVESRNSLHCVEASASMAGHLLEWPCAHARDDSSTRWPQHSRGRGVRASTQKKKHCVPACVIIARVACAHHRHSTMAQAASWQCSRQAKVFHELNLIYSQTVSYNRSISIYATPTRVLHTLGAERDRSQELLPASVPNRGIFVPLVVPK